MSEITLGGYTLDELKKMKAAVSKDAQAFIATKMQEATNYFEQLRELIGEPEGEDEVEATEEMQGLAKLANESFKQVKLVSGISGVTFYLDYHEDWGSTGDVLSSVLEDAGLSWRCGALSDLFSTLENMEYDSRNWHSSSC